MGDVEIQSAVEGEAILELVDSVINVVDDEWRSCFYKLYSAEDIAEHVAFSLIFRRARLSTLGRARLSALDGWGDQPNGNARIVGDVVDELELSAAEIVEE